MGEIATTLIGVVLPILVSIVLLAAGSSTPEEFLVVRVSLVLAAFVIFGVTVWVLYKKASAAWHYILGEMVLACLVLVPMVFKWVDERELASRNKDYGELKQEHIEIILSGNTGVVTRLMQFGDSNTMIAKTGSATGPIPPMFSFFDDAQLLIESIDDRLFVSTKVRDRKGNLVAELIFNEWKVAPSPRTWDRNFNNNTLEVQDETGRIVLQIRLLPDRVQIQGEWWKDENNGIGLFKRKDIWGDSTGIIAMLTAATRENFPAIEPLFVYPSSSHFGELKKPEN